MSVIEIFQQLPKRVAFCAQTVSISVCSQLAYEAKEHDLHRLPMCRNFIVVFAAVPAEEFSGRLSLYAIGFDRKVVCVLNRFGNRFSMASHQPVAWTDFGTRDLVLVLWR